VTSRRVTQDTDGKTRDSSVSVLPLHRGVKSQSFNVVRIEIFRQHLSGDSESESDGIINESVDERSRYDRH
jgi:hypothetical protein